MRKSNTKSEIIKLLNTRVLRTTDIYKRFGLSMSTISQHLEELVNLGYIVKVGRYYEKRIDDK